MPDIYLPAEVEAVQQWFENLLWPSPSQSQLGYLSLLAERLLLGLRQRRTAAGVLVRNYHPDFAGTAVPLILQQHWQLEAAQFTVAREHGYLDWAEVRKNGQAFFDPDWQLALRQLLSGEIGELRDLLIRRPQLASMRSPYAHRATLLHYPVANGVEIRRQQVPANAPALAQLLLQHGADPAATMSVYGGQFTPAALLSSSAHPKAAGIMKELVAVLQ